MTAGAEMSVDKLIDGFVGLVPQTKINQRLHALVSSTLQPKYRSLNLFIPNQSPRPTTHQLRVGRQWKELTNLFDTIVKELKIGGPNFTPEVLVYFIPNQSHWFDADEATRRNALLYLCREERLWNQVQHYTKEASERVKATRTERSFIHSSYQVPPSTSCQVPPSTPLQVPSTLGKIFWNDESQCMLVQYYTENLCSRRTLFTDTMRNSYLSLFRQTPCPGVNAALYSLSALYLNQTLAEAKYANIAINFIIKNLKNPGATQSIIKIVQLFIHHHVVACKTQPWSMHARAIAAIQRSVSINHEASLFVVYESILKLTNFDQPANDGISVNYLLDCEKPQEVLDFGLSRELLYLTGQINEWVREPDQARWRSKGQALLHRCETISQTVSESDESRRAIINRIAVSYKLMAKAQVLCYRGYTRHNVTLQQAADELAAVVIEIFTMCDITIAQFPLAPAFWATVLSIETGQHCYNLLQSALPDGLSNVHHALEVAKEIREYQEPKSDVEVGWFNEMLKSIHIEELSLG